MSAPPRSLPTAAAAEYLGLTVRRFRAALARGEVPGPTFRGRPNVWSVRALDKVLDGSPPARHTVGAVDTDLAGLGARIDALGTHEIP